MGVCHCTMCRRWSGGTFMAVQCTDVETSGGDALSVYDSSEWGERVFCRHCGSNIMWRSKDGSHVAVSAQAFDAPDMFSFASEIFYDQKPSNYAFANDTQKMTAAEVFALYADDQGSDNG
ncbi:GFA family protein [Breoghania sp.]|nr:GFA family protein [Breoghania sp.]